MLSAKHRGCSYDSSNEEFKYFRLLNFFLIETKVDRLTIQCGHVFPTFSIYLVKLRTPFNH